MRNRFSGPSRRDVLGVTGGAGLAALAGCVGILGGGEDDPEFEVTIQETNSPVTDGSILEVTALIENIANEEARDTIILDVAGLQPTANVSLSPGESTERTLTARMNTDGEGGEFEATVSSSHDTDTSQVTVRQPAAFRFDIVSVTDQVVDGERLEVVVEVTNEGESEGTEDVLLEAEELHRTADTQELTLGPGESETLTLGWQTSNDTDIEEIFVRIGDKEVSHEVTIFGPGAPSLTVENAPSELIQNEPIEIDVLVGNTGDFRLRRHVRLTQGDSELDSQLVALPSGEEQSITLTGVPDSEGEDTLEVSFGNLTETLPVEFTFPVNVVDSSVRETPEAAAELLDVTIENEAGREVTAEVEGEIELAGQMIQFEPPRAISDPALLTYEIPAGTHEQRRVVELPPGESEVTLKVPTPPWPFDVSYLPDGELIEINYDHDVSLSGVNEEPSLPQHRRVVVQEIVVEEIAIRDRLVAEVENIRDEPATVDVVGVLEDAGGDIDDNISRRNTVELDPGETEEIVFEDIGALLDIPGLPFVEIAGMRENTGLNTGLLVDVEEL